MRKSRLALVFVLSLASIFVLALGLFPRWLHVAPAGARVDLTSQLAGQAPGRSSTVPPPSAPAGHASLPSGNASNVIALTAGGQPLRLTLSATAGKASVPGPGHALGNGDALLFGPTLEFQFAAQGDPFDAQGHAFLRFPGFIDTKGPVDCLDVVGTKAYLSGPLSRQVIAGFDRWFVYVEDNDVADKETGTPDRISVVILKSSFFPRPDCTNTSLQSLGQGSAFAVTKGRVEADQER